MDYYYLRLISIEKLVEKSNRCLLKCIQHEKDIIYISVVFTGRDPAMLLVLTIAPETDMTRYKFSSEIFSSIT